MTSPTHAQRVLDAAVAGGRKLSVIATGGGGRAIAELCGTPGASRAFIEGLVPYAKQSIDRLLGGEQEQYCSERTARRMAVAAWQRAAEVAGPRQAVGTAVTASLASLEPKRGPHRVHVAAQTSAATHVASVELTKGARTRGEEEAVAADLAVGMLGFACGLDLSDAFDGLVLRGDDRLERESFEPPPPWQRLFDGDETAVRCGGPAGPEPVPGAVVFPGAFDPLHEGHRLMARLAEEIAEAPVEFELSITNVDKPMLDYLEIRNRAARFEASAAVWLTRAATFLEKTVVFPRATFVMGADTYRRLGDPRYYGGSQQAADDAVGRIAASIAGLIVFGRVAAGGFEDASQIEAPAPLREKAYFVSEREFRVDVSSTAIRRKAIECGGN